MKNQQTQYDIFISYRRDGGDITAGRIADRLKQQGYRVFLDVESMRSGDFNKQLYSVIESCSDVVVILPENALERCENEDDWLKLEVSHALKHNRNIIPVMLKGFKFQKVMPKGIEDLAKKEGVEASSTTYFDASMTRLMELLISKKHLTWDRVKKHVLFSLIPLLLVAAILLFIRYENKQKEQQQLEQVCKEVVSFISTGFANGNGLISTIDETNRQWKIFHSNLLKTNDLLEKNRLKDQLNQFVDYKLSQINDTSILSNWQLNPIHDELLAKNGISTEDIKASKMMFRTDFEQTKDYLVRIKYWLNTSEIGWPDQLDEGIDKLAEMNKEMINSGIYSLNELIIEMPESVRDTYNKFLPVLTNYSAEMDYHSNKKELEAKQERSLQKCNSLLGEYSAIVGDENMRVTILKNQLDSLKTISKKAKNEALNDPGIDSIKRRVVAKNEILEQQKTELNAKQKALKDAYQRVLTKCTFTPDEDQWIMWGKILRLSTVARNTMKLRKEEKAQLEINRQEAIRKGLDPNALSEPSYPVSVDELFNEIYKRIDLFVQYNQDKDPRIKEYAPIAKQYFKLLRAGEIEDSGILVFGTENNVQHPVLKPGDIVVERKGKPVYSADDYFKLKDDPAPNVVKILRLNPNGTKSIQTVTMPDTQIKVGFMNLRETE
jgi:hypothetical protein